MSLRRSARAPTTQPVITGRQNTNSSTSSLSSGRIDRNTRPTQRTDSRRSSDAARSLSPTEAQPSTDAPPRRTRSTNGENKSDRSLEGKGANKHDNEAEDEDADEEDETRCVCGQMEYPGLPITSNDEQRMKSRLDSDPTSEDSTGWFIQCDECQVWQHGGCVGILDEAQSPEKYFCEQCRKDLHDISQDLKGRSYSRYLPVQDIGSTSPSPAPKSKDSSKRTRENKPTRTELENLAKGRRATMNSRDSAYDEAEQLRRAIEESKKDSIIKSNAPRKGKRGRSDSEELEDQAKRRRTASGSSSSQSKHHRNGEASDEEREKVEKAKNMRGAAARNHRAKEVRDRELVRERERNDATRKKNTSSRRKADDVDRTPEPTSKMTSSRSAGNSSRNIQPAAATAASKSHKKGGRPPARKGRLGRNQYSKDREPQKQNNHSPRSNHSQDGDLTNANGGAHGSGMAEGNGLSKPSRPRHMNPNRTTMNDMKRRVAGILEFISHTQVELASMDAAKPRQSVQNGAARSTAASKSRGPGVEKPGVENKDSSGGQATPGDSEAVDEEVFGKLNSVEMMEVLTRRLMRWQAQYGKFGEK